MRFREFPVGGRFSSCPTLLLSSRGCASRAPAFRGRAARWLPAYRRRPNRRVIAAPKLYFSDAGVVNRLARRACRSVTTTGSPACVRTGSVPSCGADARGSRRSPCRAPRGRRRGRRPERRRASPSEWRVRPARRRGRADPRPRPRFACDCGPCAQNGEEPIGGQALPRGCCQIGPHRTQPAEHPLLLLCTRRRRARRTPPNSPVDRRANPGEECCESGKERLQLTGARESAVRVRASGASRDPRLRARRSSREMSRG